MSERKGVLDRIVSRVARKKAESFPRGYTLGVALIGHGEVGVSFVFTGTDPALLTAMAAGRLRRAGLDESGELGELLTGPTAKGMEDIEVHAADLPDLPDLMLSPEVFASQADAQQCAQVTLCLGVGHVSWTGHRPAVEVVAAQTETPGPYPIGQPVDVWDEYGDEYVAHVVAPVPGRGRFLAFNEKRDVLLYVQAPDAFARIASHQLVRKGGRRGRDFFVNFINPPTLESAFADLTGTPE